MTKLHNDLLRDIGTLARTIHYLHDLHFKELALQRGQFIFLTRICENTGINQNDLSLLLKVDKSTTAKAVQKLTAAGYINRQRSSEDQRHWQLFPKFYSVRTQRTEQAVQKNVCQSGNTLAKNKGSKTKNRGTMMLRLATMQDLTRIMAIVQATVMEMHAYGNYQWDEVYPTEQDFASDITQGDLFVSEAEGQICGLICINQTEPAVYADAGWTLAEKALVLHRMAVDPALRGRGTGSELLQQAETLALSLGLRYLKTDTYALNEKAQQLFLKHGYHFCGEIQFRKMEHQFYCYEKVL